MRMTALSPLSPGARPPLPTCAGPATGTPMDLPRGDTPLRAISEISKKTRRFLMRAIRHSIAKAALTGGGSRRHPAYIAAAQLADLADPNLHGLYDLDATEVAEALPTIRRAHIPGQLGAVRDRRRHRRAGRVHRGHSRCVAGGCRRVPGAGSSFANVARHDNRSIVGVATAPAPTVPDLQAVKYLWS